MPPRRRQRPRARSRRRRDGGRVQVAAGRLTAWRARGPSAGSRGRRVGGLALLATARVGSGPLTRPGCRRARRPGPNRRRARRPVDGGVHRGVRPPGIHGWPSGPTRRDVRTPWTVDIESREPLQPARRPGGRFPRPPRRTIRPHPTGRGRFPVANRGTIRRASRVGGRCGGRLPAANGRAVLPAGGIRGRRGGRFVTANRCAIRPVGGIQGRGCWSLHSADFGSIWTGGGAGGRCGGWFRTARWWRVWPAGGAAGRGRWTRRRRRTAGVGGEVAGGRLGWGGGIRRGRCGGPVRSGGGTWSGRCSRRRRLAGAALAADRRCGAEPGAGGREWWTIWFRVGCGGRRGPIAHGTAGSGRPRHRLGFPFAGGRRRLLGNRRFLGLLRHRPRPPAGLLRSRTVRSPPARPNGRALLTFDLGTRPIWFGAPVALLLGTWGGLPLRARVVLGVRRNGPLRPRRRRP
jgi:hypothetical protein